MNDPYDFANKNVEPGRGGYIYLIHAEGTNRYKIGRSANPLKRCETLQNQSPYPLTVIKIFYTFDMIADESSLHAEFSRSRIYGEWFEFACNIISSILCRFHSITIVNLSLLRKEQIEELCSINPKNRLWIAAWHDCQYFTLATNGDHSYYLFVEMFYYRVNKIVAQNDDRVDLLSYAVGYLDHQRDIMLYADIKPKH